MQHEGAGLDRPQARMPSHNETATLAVAGYALCVSGFFVLSAIGTSHPAATYALIFGGALLVSLPLVLLTLIVVASEAALGRAWASGFRRLDAVERTRGAILGRALRYAAVLWLANGGALWFAAIIGTF